MAPTTSITVLVHEYDNGDKGALEILQGRIAPGQKVIEGRWARHFGMAQVSVREALNILAAEGFVTKRHGRSARVLTLTETDIIHIYQIRGALEGLAARIIAERKLPLQDIESAWSAIQLAVASNDPLKVIDSVQRFHLCILDKTGNPLLLDTGKRLIVPLLAFTRMRVQAKNLDASPWVPEVSNHQRILDALRHRRSHHGPLSQGSSGRLGTLNQGERAACSSGRLFCGVSAIFLFAF